MASNLRAWFTHGLDFSEELVADILRSYGASVYCREVEIEGLEVVFMQECRGNRLVEVLKRITARSDQQKSMLAVLRHWREASRRGEDDKSTLCGSSTGNTRENYLVLAYCMW